MAVKTEAIVLSWRPLQEADRVYFVLTPAEGRLKIIARSAGRSSSKLAGHLQMFDQVRLMIGRGRQDHLAGVDIVASREAIRQDGVLLSYASAIVEATQRCQVSGPEAYREYQAVSQALDYIANPEYSLNAKGLMVRLFLWRLLALAGWQPEFQTCPLCANLIARDTMVYMPSRGFVCQHHDNRATVLPHNLAEFVRKLSTTDTWLSLIAEAVDILTPLQWSTLTRQYYEDVIEQPLHSLGFIHHFVPHVYHQAHQ
jgi:DNA repair protein RecO (recombination protein O)